MGVCVAGVAGTAGLVILARMAGVWMGDAVDKRSWAGVLGCWAKESVAAVS